MGHSAANFSLTRCDLLEGNLISSNARAESALSWPLPTGVVSASSPGVKPLYLATSPYSEGSHAKTRSEKQDAKEPIVDTVSLGVFLCSWRLCVKPLATMTTSCPS